MKRTPSFINRISNISIFSAERPTSLEADALARYYFARKYCRGRKILDIGTGLGLGARYLSENGALEVLGIDNSIKTIRFNKTYNDSKTVRFKHLDAVDIWKIKEKYDVVIAFEVIEHLPVERVGKFVMSLPKVLKKNGILLLSTPNGSKTDFLFGRPYNPYHVKEYTEGEIERLLEKYFKNICIKGIYSINSEYSGIQSEVKRSMIYKFIYVIGHFKIVRELVAYIPRDIKRIITGESRLPERDQDDYLLTKNWKDCIDLFVCAKK